MISNKDWIEQLKYVEWRANRILHDTIAYERGEISATDMCVGVSEDVSKLLEDVKELLEPGSARR